MRIALLLLLFLAGSAQAANVCDRALHAEPGAAGIHYDVTGAPKIVVISGTDRPGSNTSKVAKIVARALQSSGADVEIVDLADLPKNTFTGGYGNPPKSFAKFQNPIKEADGVVVLTPEYNGSMPGALKYFLDLLKYDTFKEKPTSIIGLAAGFQGATTASDDLRSVLQHLQANVNGMATSLPKIDELLASPGDSFDRVFDQMTKFKAFVEALHPMDPSAKETLSISRVLKKVAQSKQVHTIEYDSGVEVSGVLKKTLTSKKGEPAYFQFDGPTQLSVQGKEIEGQGVKTHAQGFGSPIGKLLGMSDGQLQQIGDREGSQVTLEFESGIHVQGTVTGTTRDGSGKLILIQFNNCTVTAPDGAILFDPSWGQYDMAVGSSVKDVSPGAADAKAYFKGIQ